MGSVLGLLVFRVYIGAPHFRKIPSGSLMCRATTAETGRADDETDNRSSNENSRARGAPTFDTT